MALVKYNNNSISAVTAVAGLTSGAMTLIKEQTASSSSTISFVHGTSDVVLDSTYPIYVFKLISIHPSAGDGYLSFNGTTDGSNWNVTKTSTTWQAQHDEADTETALQYNADRDLVESTGAQRFSLQIGNANDECVVGTLHIFSPSDTTFVKHYSAIVNGYNGSDYSQQLFTGGYMNTTSAVDAIQFSFQSGDIDAGSISLYGIS